MNIFSNCDEKGELEFPKRDTISDIMLLRLRYIIIILENMVNVAKNDRLQVNRIACV